MKKVMNFFCRITLMILAFVTSASSGVMMADASNLPDAGKMTAGADGTGGTDGIATETGGRENGDPNFYLSDVDKRIVKIRPMATPIDQISRYAKSSSTNSFEVKYYSVGTREIKCSTNKKLEAMTGGASVSLPVSDLNMFTLDDTIRVVGVSAITKPDGTAYSESDSNVPDLELCVCGKDSSTNLPTVYAVNGKMDDSSKQPILLPEIPQGTTLVRMGKACGELDVQTGRFNNIPMPETQYCQNYHELFDVNGMSDCGFAMDPEYLSKKTHVSWARNVLDLKKAGIRRTDAVVIQEVSCLYLRYAKAHARMRLAKAPATVEDSGSETA